MSYHAAHSAMEMSLHCHNHWDVVEGLRQCSRCGQTFCRDCLVDIRGNPYCAICKNEQLLDVQSGIPVGTALDLADPWRRFAALLIDNLLLSIPLAIIMGIVILSMMSGGRAFSPQMFAVLQPINWLYIIVVIVYEGLMLSARGQTVGKIAMKIKVVRVDGSDITKGQAWGRSAIRHVLVSCLCIIDYLPAFFTQERTALHDMVATTRVINWQ